MLELTISSIPRVCWEVERDRSERMRHCERERDIRQSDGAVEVGVEKVSTAIVDGRKAKFTIKPKSSGIPGSTEQ